MLYKKIKTVGDIYIESEINNGLGSKICQEFLARLAEEFSKQSSAYIRATYEAPFIYRERQLSSIIAPALSKFTQAFMMESPVKRKWSAVSNEKADDSHGWIDYWCYYRDVVFLIELKHGFISSRNTQVRKNVAEGWNKAIQQLKVVKQEAEYDGEWSKGAFLVALSVLPIFEACTDSKTIGELDGLLEIQKTYPKKFKPAPNWTGLWKLHSNLVGPYEYEKSTEYYHGVLFIAKVSKIYAK